VVTYPADLEPVVEFLQQQGTDPEPDAETA
jgi:hypothetical protein